MTRTARPARLAAIVLVPVLLLAAVAAGAAGTHERRPAGLAVQGSSVSGLVPGRADRLTVTIRNKTRKPVRITAVTAKVRTAPPGCPASMLKVGSVKPAGRLRPGRSLAVRLPVQLVRTAPDACQGVRFPLAVRASARR